jgi:acetolactate synthase small subunit
MAEFSARVACAAGCLDQFAEAFDARGPRLESLACLAQEGGEGVVTFSVEESKDFSIPGVETRETGTAVLQVKVANRAGCLAGVTSSLTKAGVTIGSLACACAAGDESGIVSVGLTPRG